MKTTNLLFLLLFSSLLLCSCEKETSFSFDRKMIGEKYEKFPDFDCSSLITYWNVEFEGTRSKMLFGSETAHFNQSFKLIFEKRWINGLAQWMPVTFDLGDSGSSMADFVKLSVYPSCHFFLENPQSKYVSYDLEFEILLVQDEKRIGALFPQEFKFADYNRDVNEIDGFTIPHQSIYESGDLKQENYISINSKLRFQNTKEGLKFVKVSGLEESTKSIIGFKNFYDVKVTEYLDTALFIKTEYPNSASFGRAGICIYLDELDSMINSINTTEQK